MKRIFTLCVALCTIASSFAQTDTTATPQPAPQDDTIRIGGMVITQSRQQRQRDHPRQGI